MAQSDVTAVLTAKTDGFETALNRAAKASEDTARSVQASTDKISDSFSFLKGVAEGALAAFSINAFVGLVKGSIDAADHLNDLSKKTGVAVETLGGFGFAAEQAGGNLDSMAKGLGKLDLTIAQANAGNAKAKEFFDVLGISINASSKAADLLPAIADQFASFEDGPNKAALAVRGFGKAGADLIPVLDDGGDKLKENVGYYERYSGVTADLAAKSDAFNDSLAKVHLLSGAFGKTLASELLPTLQTLVDILIESKEKGTLFTTVAEGIAKVFNELVIAGAEVVHAFNDVGIEIGGTAAKIDALLHLDLKGFHAISAAMKEDTTAADKALDDFRNKLRGKANFNVIDFGNEPQAPKKDAPQLKSTTKAAAGPDLDKKLLDQQLKDLDHYIASERELLSDRNSFLQIYYQNDDISIEAYYAGRKVARDEDVRNLTAAYDKEIAATQAYIASKSGSNDPKDQGKVIEANTKLLDIQDKLRKAQGDAATQSQKDYIAQGIAVDKYRDKLKGLQAQVETLRGNSAGATAISFDIQNKSIRKDLTNDLSSSDQSTRAAAQAGLENLDTLRQQAVVTAALSDQEKKRNDALGALQNAQDRINNAVTAGRTTELEGLQQLSEANKARVPQLEAIAAAYDRIAATSLDPAAAVAAERIRIELDKLKDSTDLVADKFRAIGESATENFIDKLASGTVKLKDAFKGLVSDINKDLLKIGEKEISQQIFKKDGAIGSFISSIFGKSGAGDAAKTAATATGAAGSAATGAAFSTAVDAAGIAFGTATDAAGVAFGAGTDAAGIAFGAAADAAGVAFSATTEAAGVGLTAVLETAGAAFAATIEAAAASFAATVATSSASSAAGGIAKAASVASANGNVFSMGNVIPFSRGGVIDTPSIFPLANGRTGIAAEAGPEAIVPLRRGRDGRLGISAPAQTAGPVTNIAINVPAPQTRDLRTASQYGRDIGRQLQR